VNAPWILLLVVIRGVGGRCLLSTYLSCLVCGPNPSSCSCLFERSREPASHLGFSGPSCWRLLYTVPLRFVPPLPAPLPPCLLANGKNDEFIAPQSPPPPRFPILSTLRVPVLPGGLDYLPLRLPPAAAAAAAVAVRKWPAAAVARGAAEKKANAEHNRAFAEDGEGGKNCHKCHHNASDRCVRELDGCFR